MVVDLVPVPVPSVYLCQPGYRGQLLLDGGGIAVNPLQAVHVCVQDLNNEQAGTAQFHL